MERNLRKALVGLLLAASPMVAVVAGATTAHAVPAVEINHGWCNQEVDPHLRYYLAPGAYGNGPFVIVNGDFKSTQGNGFEGYMGCYK